eukprot:1157389-Rhodomonas_salina.1
MSPDANMLDRLLSREEAADKQQLAVANEQQLATRKLLDHTSQWHYGDDVTVCLRRRNPLRQRPQPSHRLPRTSKPPTLLSPSPLLPPPRPPLCPLSLPLQRQQSSPSTPRRDRARPCTRCVLYSARCLSVLDRGRVPDAESCVRAGRSAGGGEAAGAGNRSPGAVAHAADGR